MSTVAPPRAEPRSPGVRGLIRERAQARTGEAAWVLPATAGVLLLAALLYLLNLRVSGYANVYYSAAAWAASQSWSAWFFGSVDPANFITLDKPPLATMVMGIFVRLFGLSSMSVLLPQALMGVATVALLVAVVRRTFGAAASIIAGLVMALTPAAVLIFRYNNPDALLTLLLVGAAYALVRALDTDRLSWVALAGFLVGLAFETKLLQAYLVLPAFGITWAIAAPGSMRRRIAGLAVAAVTVVAGSVWWVGAMELIPAASRPFVGGSTNNTALDLVLGYDGLGRIFGEGGPSTPAGATGIGSPSGGPGGGFSGTPGILRLFNSELGGQVVWFLPLSLVGLVAGLVARFRARRTDVARAAYLLWGLWLLVHVIVFSLMSGIIHSYYVVVMAPAIGALVGGGVVELWRARARFAWAGATLGIAILGSAGIAWMLLERTPSFAPGLGAVVVAAAVVALPVIALRPRAGRARAQLLAAVLGLAVLLVGPGAYAASTMATAYSGGDPSAGPLAASADRGPGGNGSGPVANSASPFGPGANRAGPFGNGAGPLANGAGPGMGPGGITGGTPGFPPAAGVGGAGGTAGGPDIGLGSDLTGYLVANQGSARWIVAVSGANSAGQIELATGKPVMAMGGFSGSDNAPTLDQLQRLIAAGKLRFVAAGGGGAPGAGEGSASSVTSWVTSACSAVDLGRGSTRVYDCAGTVSW